MKPAEMRSMTEDQLGKLETELQVEWRNLRFQESVGQLTNNARIRTIRKDLARILTIRHERVLDADLGN
jgi:large subunit ribosomal protein L29